MQMNIIYRTYLSASVLSVFYSEGTSVGVASPNRRHKTAASGGGRVRSISIGKINIGWHKPAPTVPYILLKIIIDRYLQTQPFPVSLALAWFLINLHKLHRLFDDWDRHF
jgi:hypothetical protein